MAEGAISLLLRELGGIAERAKPLGTPLIIGGGVGLLLRDQRIRARGSRTLRSYPALRATSDLDLFLGAEIIADPHLMRGLRAVLDQEGFEPIGGTEYYQFVKQMPEGSALPAVKVDLLAAPPPEHDLMVDERRIRPRGFRGLHAHVTPEALTIEDGLVEVLVPSGTSAVGVLLPHPFSYVILKLFAFRDRRDDPDKQFGRYHAFDIYTSVAMMNEEEFSEGREMRRRYADSPELREAQGIAASFFSSPTDLGLLRMREHMREARISKEAVDLDGFLLDLRDIFA
jgi:hypothetical protein